MFYFNLWMYLYMKQILVVLSIILFIGGCQFSTIPGMTPTTQEAPIAEAQTEDTLSTQIKLEPPVSPVVVEASNRLQALVIGNRNYQKGPDLKNSINDAVSMRDTLKDMGFEVTFKTNLKNPTAMDAVINDFVEHLAVLNQQGITNAVGLFYFAGHGVNREKDRKNFLIPTDDTLIRNAEDLDDNAVWERSVVNRMQQANKALNIAIVDACRNYALARSVSGLTTRGLRQAVEGDISSQTKVIKGGTVIAFSASDGQQSSDEGPDGVHGLYTYHLLGVIKSLPPDAARLEDIFMYTRNKVSKENQSQTPVAEFGLNSLCTLTGCM